MKVYLVCSKEIDTNETILHSAFLDIEKAREQIEELRENDDDDYYYIEDMKIEDYENEQVEG